MSGPILYSANPWYSHEVAKLYRGGCHFAWCSEYFDCSQAPAVSGASAIAPSSNPKEIYRRLNADCDGEDRHSFNIKNYQKKFKRLANQWFSVGEINADQRDEIIATVRSDSMKIWRPVLYIIPRAPIETAGRLIKVPHADRAAYGPELQIRDLMPQEFDLIRLETL